MRKIPYFYPFLHLAGKIHFAPFFRGMISTVFPQLLFFCQETIKPKKWKPGDTSYGWFYKLALTDFDSVFEVKV